MLHITIPSTEYYDGSRNLFIEVPSVELNLQHSLRSIAKWEAIWKVPFLATKELSEDQLASYISCMSDGPVDESVVVCLTSEDVERIGSYIGDTMTATTFPESKDRPSREKISSELIYYWMISANVPFECQDWHLNRLLTLLRVISIKSGPQKKMSKSEIAARNRQLNEQRRQQLGTRG